MHALIEVLKVFAFVAALFGAGVATSFAEYKFDYSLYELVKEKLTGKKG